MKDTNLRRKARQQAYERACDVVMKEGHLLSTTELSIRLKIIGISNRTIKIIREKLGIPEPVTGYLRRSDFREDKK